MNIENFATAMFEYVSLALMVLGALVFVVNIIVETIKGLLPKLPTNILAFIVAIAVTLLALFIGAEILKITVMWYYAVGAVVLGFFVAYAAMFGFDKLKDAIEKLRKQLGK